MKRILPLMVFVGVAHGLAGCDATGPEEEVRFAQVAVGRSHSCARTVDGRAFCWGEGHSGQLGNGNPFPVAHPVSANLSGEAVDLAAGTDHVCAAMADATVRCWGRNDYGRLGNGSNANQAVPVAVVFLGTPMETVGAGFQHSCAVARDARVFCWGHGYYGELGTGDRVELWTPAPANTGVPMRTVDGGHEFTCGLSTDDRAFCWGHGAGGVMGNSSDADRLVPSEVNGGYRFQQISAGRLYACGLTLDGHALCWGSGIWEPNGPVAGNFLPERIGDLRFKAVTAGFQYGCGIGIADERVYCWGVNSDAGRLGAGDVENSFLPRPVAGGLRFADVAAGDLHVCATTLDGQVYCWGDNLSGQLGNDRENFSTVPGPVAAPATH